MKGSLLYYVILLFEVYVNYVLRVRCYTVNKVSKCGIYLLEGRTKYWASVVPVSDMLRKLFTVVVAMLSSASFVKNAWCPLTTKVSINNVIEVCERSRHENIVKGQQSCEAVVGDNLCA